jgi:hypothetical protein
VSHLFNIGETLAMTVGAKLGFKTMPKPADAAMPTRQDLEPSPALSIIEEGLKLFEGRKLGILATDGADAALLDALRRDFVADAFFHCKFIGYGDAAMPLLEKAGIAGNLDEGVICPGLHGPTWDAADLGAGTLGQAEQVDTG